jgi:hypothetical protein
MLWAAESGALCKVQWLHEIRKCSLPDGIDQWAAKSGTLQMLTWLTEQGCTFGRGTCVEAAAAGREHVLRHLRAQGCEWDEETTGAAAEFGHLSLVKWLISAGCPFTKSTICEDAARSGSIEMIVYARQRGCELNAKVMEAAAERGRLSMCQYLHSEGCALDETAATGAAYYGRIGTLRWLREQGCPWAAVEVCSKAAEGGRIEVMHYLVNKLAVATPEVLQDMLYAAGACNKLAAAQWLRQQGAEWPTDLYEWNEVCLAWARQQGCTAPVDGYDSDTDDDVL